MNKIKQMLCIALTFVILGGCTQIKKDKTPAETTTADVLQTASQTLATETESTVETESEQLTDVADAEETTEKFTAESTTANKTAEKSSTKVATTRKPAATTTKPTTTKPTATKPTTGPATTVPTTQKVTAANTTTQAPTTSAAVTAQSEDGIIIGFKRVLFGCGKQDITAIFGNPTETVTETLNSGGTVTSLVYADDYSDFAVFQLLNGKFFGFYTCVNDTLVTDGKKTYSLRTGGEKQIGNVEIFEYADSQKNGKAYAFKANYNGIGYFPAQLDNLDGQERLIFHATNALRAINGVSPLEYSDKAAECVRRHCEDMSARNYFSHDTPEGVSSAQRMKNMGISYMTCGENLAAGFEDAFGMADGWYNSPGHRRNMLEKNFRYVGIGVAEGNGTYHIYAGQNYYA